MYEPIKIGKLSKAVISKMLRGHSVRIRKGDAHVIHLSKEQLKKHERASKKDAGHTIMLDPYQIQSHQYLKGKGLLIDEPVSTRQATAKISKFIQNPMAMLDGQGLLIDEPITTRQVVDKTGDFFKNPKKMLGFGKARKGGKLSLKGEGLLDDLKDLGHKIEQGFKSKVADPIQKVNIQKEAENLG